MASLVSFPTEITARIFQDCNDFPQIIALATTCKHLYSIWVANSSTIIYKLAESKVRCFNDALMTVRATAIVLKAYQLGIQPPLVSMNELSSQFKKPSLEEFKEVLNLQHLIRCVEYMFFNRHDSWDYNLFGYGMPALREEPDIGEEEAYKDRFYGAMYRILLAGAVLSRVYTEPFFQARKEGKVGFLKNQEETNRLYQRDHFDEDNDGLTNEDAEYLRQFPVYNFDVLDESEIGKWRNREYETHFGPFSSWLVEDGRAKTLPPSRRPRDDSWLLHRGPVQELMCLLTAYDHLNCKFTHEDGSESTDVCSGITDAHEINTTTGDTRKVSVVLYGVFHVEEITMPTRFEVLTDSCLKANPHPALKGTLTETIHKDFDVSCVLYSLQLKSRSTYVDTSGEHPEPPPLFELWHFTLRHYLNLGFSSGCFWMWRECMWWEDVGGGTVFSDPDWAIVQPYEAGVVSWHSQEDL